MAKSLKTPAENKQEVLRNGLCVWSIKKLDGSGWDCSVNNEKCIIDVDPKKCPAVVDEKAVVKMFMERDVPREHY